MDLVRVMEHDSGARIRRLRVDGGASLNDFLMQFQADLLGVPIERPSMVETTALGAAYLAGIGAGIWERRDRVPGGGEAGKVFRPRLSRARRERLAAGWRSAVELLLKS
jgi:glycerol kinase